ncbi:TetR/AcrR family transcriptional regulator (plasmid) [Rhizobium sp. C104]|uniref:TetR/AcrR family transcriptional regulator n=1 Tax=Rhizobium sp. C104 TaxID=2917727 RepID=UPI001EF79D34|nr:TetR/AcrR family transcriptional regulator [Rhizobium sp. C104]ULJ81805.1 TetR/AcrR family transcriptional regulator [Rhizobium sp. C104]
MAPSVRERILAAGLERFHALGYEGCGVQEISDTAGVPKGSFYNHFKSKEELAVAVLEQYAASSQREILLDANLAPIDRIRRHFEFCLARHQQNGFDRGCLIANLTAENSTAVPDLQAALRSDLDRWTESLAAAVKAAQEIGQVRADIEASDLARFLVSSWEGCELRTKLTGDRGPLDDFFKMAFALLSNVGPHQL